MKITINGKAYECTPGQTIYEVARDNGIYIPVLCHHEQLKPVGACRVCVVEVQKAKTLVASCAMPAEEGMIVTDRYRARPPVKTVHGRAAPHPGAPQLRHLREQAATASCRTWPIPWASRCPASANPTGVQDPWSRPTR